MTEPEALRFAAEILRIDDLMFYNSRPHEEAIKLLKELSENPEQIEVYKGLVKRKEK